MVNSLTLLQEFIEISMRCLNVFWTNVAIYIYFTTDVSTEVSMHVILIHGLDDDQIFITFSVKKSLEISM